MKRSNMKRQEVKSSKTRQHRRAEIEVRENPAQGVYGYSSAALDSELHQARKLTRHGGHRPRAPFSGRVLKPDLSATILGPNCPFRLFVPPYGIHGLAMFQIGTAQRWLHEHADDPVHAIQPAAGRCGQGNPGPMDALYFPADRATRAKSSCAPRRPAIRDRGPPSIPPRHPRDNISSMSFPHSVSLGKRNAP